MLPATRLAATSTDYLYDADGGLLIRRPTGRDGETVLYLGSTEVHLVIAGTTKTLKGVRYYAAGVGGQTIAMRTGVRGVSGTKVPGWPPTTTAPPVWRSTTRR
jgi:hypothetical protein